MQAATVAAASEPELYAYRAAELEHMFTEVSVARVTDVFARAHALTRLARVHARISGTCRLCARAQPYVQHAIERAPAARGCEAGLDYLLLLVRDSPDVVAADGFGRGLLLRFGALPSCTECVAATRRLHAELNARTAAAPKIAALEPPRSHDLAVTGHAAARYVAQREGGRIGAQLQTITVYGALDAPDVREVRVVLGFDGHVMFRRGELAADGASARRVVLDFDHVQRAPALAESIASGVGGITHIRTFALDATTTRVAFEVQAGTQYRLFFLPQPYRVVIDFQTREPRPQLSAAVRTIVLDPGHGGVHGGARSSNGLSEAEVALSLAQRVRKTLARTLPKPRVVLTRDQDRAVSLEERTAIANALDADLFVSIHLNASPSPDDRGGVSTYVLDATHDAQALGLAARENDAAEADLSELQPLFASLVRRDQVARSLDLAHVVHQSTLRAGRRKLPDLADRGVKRALFYVLVGARMPSILCEASFLTRPEEAAALRTDHYRQLLAEGIADGIARYVRRVEGARIVPAVSQRD